MSFVSAAKLHNGDFYDLWHLIKPGRAKWQPLLAAKTAALLEKYGHGRSTDAGRPPPSASPSP